MIGIHPDLSSQDYHAHKESISRSAMMDFKRSPYTYWAMHLNPERPEKLATPSMIFGSAFHTFILEPHLFDKEYIVEPETLKLPKVGLLRDLGRPEYDKQKSERDYVSLQNKIRLEEFEAQADGKITLTTDQMLTLLAMRDALQKHPTAMQLVTGATYEQSYFWQDKESGLIVKARPDIIHDNMIVDLKTIADASPSNFQRSMVSGGYHVQGAVIRDGIRALTGQDIPNVINIAVQTSYPYSIGIYIIDEYALEQGREEYKQLLVDIKSAFVNNNFPDYEVQTVSLPTWAIR